MSLFTRPLPQTPQTAAILLVTAALSAMVNQYSAGIIGLAPIVIALLGPGPIDLPWWAAAICVVVGVLSAAAMCWALATDVSHG